MTAIATALLSCLSSEGLNTTYFENTAIHGAGCHTALSSNLENVSTTHGSICHTNGAPHAMRITGRIQPSSAGKYGFQVQFHPDLTFPDPNAYAHLWVNDVMLWPRNSRNQSVSDRSPHTPCIGCLAPIWMPLPPRVLDVHGNIVDVDGQPSLGSYELRFEYVCRSLSGCMDRNITVRWTQFPSSVEGNHSPSYVPIPSKCLESTSSVNEVARRALYTKLEQGWGTWDHRSSLSWVLLPEGFALRFGFARLSTAAVLQYTDNLVVQTAVHPTVADPNPTFVVKTGLHSVDQHFAEVSISWRGDSGQQSGGGSDPDALNISISAVVDQNDSSKLSLVTHINNPGKVNLSDYAVIVNPAFMYGRSGSVKVDMGQDSIVTGSATGLRTKTITVLQGKVISDLPCSIRNKLNFSDYLALSLDEGSPILTTDANTTSTESKTAVTVSRQREEKLLKKYKDWADVKDAIQSSLMWSLIYDPKYSLLAPSYAGVSGLGGNAETIQIDGGTTEGIFEWDQSFVSYMFGLDSLDLALSNLIAVVKSKTVAGFIPGLSAGTSKTRSTTQPPITTKALYELVKRWGIARTKWAVELCFDDLFLGNSWMYTQRRERPLELLTCGDSPYNSWAPDGSKQASVPGDGWGCSGLDNGPTVEGLPFNRTGLYLQDQYDAGFTGMFLMDTRALLSLAEHIGRSDAVAELEQRFNAVNTAMLKHLWNATEGVFQNLLSTPLQPLGHLAPVHFYPLLAGPEKGPSEEMVKATVQKALTNPVKMAVWPSGTPPSNLPPETSRPLVQWFSHKCDKGFPCKGSPHALCAQPRCNYRYAVGDFVQRAHGKLRYEGMAIWRNPSDSSLKHLARMALTPIFEYNCTGGDVALGLKDWHSSKATSCTLISHGPVFWTLPDPVEPWKDSLVELEVWYRPGDHYTVGSPAGRADAAANNYSRIGSLGYVWPAPGTPYATSRYALPSLSKDDQFYAAQDYWKGRAWSPMIQLVYWGLSEYKSPEARGARAGLVAQSRALMLKEWLGYPSDNKWAGTGRRVMENYDADTGEGYSYSSSAAPLYAWGALAGMIGLVENGFYDPLP